LYDFINTRISTYTQKVVDQINKNHLIEIKGKNYKKYHHYIYAAIKYEFLSDGVQLSKN
jgi:hypothetical protein